MRSFSILSGSQDIFHDIKLDFPVITTHQIILFLTFPATTYKFSLLYHKNLLIITQNQCNVVKQESRLITTLEVCCYDEEKIQINRNRSWGQSCHMIDVDNWQDVLMHCVCELVSYCSVRLGHVGYISDCQQPGLWLCEWVWLVTCQWWTPPLTSC